jgi:hypothetical protein
MLTASAAPRAAPFSKLVGNELYAKLKFGRKRGPVPRRSEKRRGGADERT